MFFKDHIDEVMNPIVVKQYERPEAEEIGLGPYESVCLYPTQGNEGITDDGEQDW